jgi:dolichyl-phosphate-mannose--protein O-mannosyl transferase
LLAALKTPLACLIFLAIVAGVVLRLHAINFPRFFLFDEHHFVENGRNYLAHVPDWNDHPPLGKFFIAITIRLFGDGPIGWRMPSLAAGFLTMLVGALAAGRLFREARAAWLTAALLACDGFAIAYSRTALLDGNLALACVLALLLASYTPSWPRTILAGVLAGAAISIKFSGIAVALPLFVGLSCSTLRPSAKLLRILVVGGLAMAFYLAQFCLGLSLTGKPATPAFALSETLRLLEAHANATEMKNPWVSGWPTWILPWRALVIGYTADGARVRALSGLGNLITWWSAVGLGLTTFGAVIWRGVGRTLGLGAFSQGAAPVVTAPVAAMPSSSFSRSAFRGAFDAFLESRGRGVVTTLAGVVGFLAPWVLTHRDSYIYHFLPCYAALLVLLGGFVAFVSRRWPRATLVWFGLVLTVTFIYAPVWSFFVTDAAGFRARLFLPTWR